mmetsp:Transcript_38868/g.91497  ORF Transcript_38868/g.91497 Transcript_38868/m.91497 type:complete len:355 (-) Transcript_38868:1368-2432(-)
MTSHDFLLWSYCDVVSVLLPCELPLNVRQASKMSPQLILNCLHKSCSCGLSVVDSDEGQAIISSGGTPHVLYDNSNLVGTGAICILGACIDSKVVGRHLEVRDTVHLIENELIVKPYSLNCVIGVEELVQPCSVDLRQDTACSVQTSGHGRHLDNVVRVSHLRDRRFIQFHLALKWHNCDLKRLLLLLRSTHKRQLYGQERVKGNRDPPATGMWASHHGLEETQEKIINSAAVPLLVVPSCLLCHHMILSAIRLLELNEWLGTSHLVYILFEAIQHILNELHRILLTIARKLLSKLANLPLEISRSHLSGTGHPHHIHELGVSLGKSACSLESILVDALLVLTRGEVLPHSRDI